MQFCFVFLFLGVIIVTSYLTAARYYEFMTNIKKILRTGFRDVDPARFCVFA